MCFGGGPVGPQKYSGGSSSAANQTSDKHRDSEGNTFGSKAYHDKIRSDAAGRNQGKTYSRNINISDQEQRGSGRRGQKSLLSTIRSIF